MKKRFKKVVESEDSLLGNLIFLVMVTLFTFFLGLYLIEIDLIISIGLFVLSGMQLYNLIYFIIKFFMERKVYWEEIK